MLKSMTAFARENCTTDSGTLTWEVRSVNHRYLEPSFRLPDLFRETEPGLREALRKYLSRGKLECNLKWQAATEQGMDININHNALDALQKATQQIASKLSQTAPIDLLGALSWPGIVDQDPRNKKSLLNAALDSFEKTLQNLNENRLREGQQLAPLFEARLIKISEIVAEVRLNLPQILAQQSHNLRQRFEEAKIEPDDQRLEQELVLIAQKSDVAEELDRLDAHVVEVRSTLASNEPVGRRLDFLMQELNREANTLSSKAIVTDTTKAAIDLKVLIEQMREQVQNIE